MKAIVVLLALTTASLGLVCILQFEKLRQQQSRLAVLDKDTAQMSEQVRDLQEAQQRAAEQRKLLMSQSEELAAQLQTRENVATQAVAQVPVPVATAPVAETNDNP